MSLTSGPAPDAPKLHAPDRSTEADRDTSRFPGPDKILDEIGRKHRIMARLKEIFKDHSLASEYAELRLDPERTLGANQGWEKLLNTIVTGASSLSFISHDPAKGRSGEDHPCLGFIFFKV